MKPIEFYITKDIQEKDFKARYLQFRVSRIKHQLWLSNRRSDRKVLYESDKVILDQCQAGTTGIYESAGYYIKDLFPSHDIEVIESNPVVKEFYPSCINLARKDLPVLGKRYDNFIVTNARSDYWVNLDGLAEHIRTYMKVMRKNCRFFYSFRDTQILGFNRLKVDMEELFLYWAKSLKQSHGLELINHDIDFKKKIKQKDGGYDLQENPDTTNGNIKFVFVLR